MIRFLGFAVGLLLYLVIAAWLFFQIMIGDCDPAPVAHAHCEAARSNWLLGLAAVSVVVVGFLAWVFLRLGKRQGTD